MLTLQHMRGAAAYYGAAAYQGAAVGPVLSLVKAPADCPVTLDEAKAHLRVTDTTEDAVIAALLAAACEQVESLTGRALAEQEWQLQLDGFPLGVSYGARWSGTLPAPGYATIDLPLPPCIAVEQITYRSTDDFGAPIIVTLDPSEYEASIPKGPKALPARIWPAQGASWPTVELAASVFIQYSCGYKVDPPESQFPAALRAAILLTLGDLYCNREGKQAANIIDNPTVAALIGPYRVLVL